MGQNLFAFWTNYTDTQYFFWFLSVFKFGLLVLHTEDVLID